MNKPFLFALISGVFLATSAWAVTSPRPIQSSQNGQDTSSNTSDQPLGGRMMISNKMSQSGSQNANHALSNTSKSHAQSDSKHSQNDSSSDSNGHDKQAHNKQNKTQSQAVTTEHPVATFKLKSNPSTGFTWYIKNYPQKLVSIKSHKMKRPSQSEHRVGAPGYEVWQFKVKQAAFKAPHVIPIELMYARPWMVGGHSGQTRTLYIVTH